MGKSRSSRYGSERLLHPAATHHAHVAVAVVDHLADLQEEDVWSVLAAPAPDSSGRNCRQPGEQDRRGGRWAAGGLSLAFDGHGGTAATPASHRHHHHHVTPLASSAPVKVPEWPGAQQDSYREHESSEEGEWVAPHEYVQGRGGGGTSTTASVFEGVGRTLKGRDLSRVRDAVWSNTGFFG